MKLKKLTDNKQHYRLKRNASKHYLPRIINNKKEKNND